ncbi:hypothetical protein Pres01_46710 [Metapseudomonas resinovorans]|nr:hypothetical protein Pres01_46710 [Pseudomonas resinovorans]
MFIARDAAAGLTNVVPMVHVIMQRSVIDMAGNAIWEIAIVIPEREIKVIPHVICLSKEDLLNIRVARIPAIK